MKQTPKNFWRLDARKPMGGRFLGVVIFAACTLFGSGAATQTSTLTESKAVDRALSVEGIESGWAAEVQAIEAQSKATRRWPNPSVSYSREQTVLEGEDVAEDFILLEQALPIGGQRRLMAEALEIRAEAQELENRARARKLAAEVRTAFYRVLYAQKRAEVYERWLDEMRRLEETFEKRVEAGDTAPYELDRLQVEISTIRSRKDVEAAQLAEQRARLAGLIGQAEVGNGEDIEGRLLPESLPTEEQLKASLDRRPILRASQRRVEAAERQVKAAKRQWVPEPTLTGGYKRSDASGQVDHGFVAGISLDLPLADRGTAAADAARSDEIRAESELDVQRRRVRAAYVGLLRKARQLRQAAVSFNEDGIAAAEHAYQTARKSYRAGEAGILELVDAYRRQIDARLRHLKLAHMARQAEVALEMAPREQQEESQ